MDKTRICIQEGTHLQKVDSHGYCLICDDERDFGEFLGDRFKDFTAHLYKSGFHFVDSGSFRDTFARKNIVVKVPYVSDGIIDNIMEARAWKKYHNRPTNLGFHLAPCRLLSNYCLMMAKVEVLNEWRGDYRLDSEQVGYYKGAIVAYDYALDLSERILWEKEVGQSKFFNTYYAVRKPHLTNGCP